jgi:hypothetical protein
MAAKKASKPAQKPQGLKDDIVKGAAKAVKKIAKNSRTPKVTNQKKVNDRNVSAIQKNKKTDVIYQEKLGQLFDVIGPKTGISPQQMSQLWKVSERAQRSQAYNKMIGTSNPYKKGKGKGK